MLALTFVTGLLDAVGYLALDRVFTGNMTGNVVILGMGMAGEDQLPVAGPLVALCAYVVGAAVVGRLLQRRRQGWEPVVTAVFATSAVVLAAVAAVLTTVEVSGRAPIGVGVAATLAALMGAQAATARMLAVADITTVVVTSTLTAYASETLFGPGWLWLTHRRLWAIVVIIAGAFCGASLLHLGAGLPVYVAAAATALVAVVGHLQWHGQ
ncbi:DUF1275 domain-containing protein [Mycolicibacterium sp. CH28]|nr:DUF1275 domain-containing protein [Mycolicibacterium sp. CH28]